MAKESAARPGIKRTLRMMFIVIVIVMVAYLIYGKRFQIEAKLWHWRHGYSTSVGEYDVPVPDQWLVENYNSLQTIDLINTHVERNAGPLETVSMAGVNYLPQPVRDLDVWESLKRQSLERDRSLSSRY